MNRVNAVQSGEPASLLPLPLSNIFNVAASKVDSRWINDKRSELNSPVIARLPEYRTEEMKSVEVVDWTRVQTCPDRLKPLL